MIEVEVKVHIKDFDEIKKSLEKRGARFFDKIKHKDRLFALAGDFDDEHKVIEGRIVARIREADGKKELEFKEIDRKGGSTVELKYDIEELPAIERILKKLGFEEAPFVAVKTRETYSCEGFTVCLDDVEKLGKFVEIEKIIQSEAKKEETFKECIKFLKQLITDFEIEDRKYGDMLQELVNKKIREP